MEIALKCRLNKPMKTGYSYGQTKVSQKIIMAGKQKTYPKLVADDRYGAGKSKRRGSLQNKRTVEASKSKARKTSGNIFKKAMSWVIKGLLGLFWSVFWRASFVIFLFLVTAIGYFAVNLPDVGKLLDARARGSVTLMDRNGDVFAWRGEQFGGAADAKSVSQALKNAIIATEDKRFYSHFGISPRGIASAIRINLSEGRSALSGHGGSTITQQTAKLLCLGVPFDKTLWDSETAYEAYCRKGSLWRKVKEAAYAIALETRYSKDEILTIYINRTFLGAGSRGFQAAAKRYFGKSAADVNVAESAMLAGLLVAPTRYAPTNNLDRSRDRARLIISLMEEQNYISKSEADFARNNPAKLSAAAQARAGGYFADWVMQSGPSFFTDNTTEDVIIKTTLDQSIQHAAEQALKTTFNTQVRKGSKAQAAIVVMSANGAVRAMVGGRKTKVDSAFNRATQALRQTGSVFKPFVYATALDLGYGPNDIVDDSPLTLSIPGSGQWSPKNYTGKYLGPVTLSEAFSQSLNIPAVRLSEAVGRENVRTVAASFGLSTDLAQGPAIALGASEATLIEMTGAYAGILNGGSSVTPYGLLDLRLLGEDTEIMGKSGGIGERVIKEDAARQLMYIMSKTVSEGTGKRAAIKGWQIGAKTGTTQAARDAWFIGFTSDYVVGVWMGYDDNTPLNGVTGGGLPAYIWRETMLGIYGLKSPAPLPISAYNISPAGVYKLRQNQSAATNPIKNLLHGILRKPQSN